MTIQFCGTVEKSRKFHLINGKIVSPSKKFGGSAVGGVVKKYWSYGEMAMEVLHEDILPLGFRYQEQIRDGTNPRAPLITFVLPTAVRGSYYSNCFLFFPIATSFR